MRDVAIREIAMQIATSQEQAWGTLPDRLRRVYLAHAEVILALIEGHGWKRND